MESGCADTARHVEGERMTTLMEMMTEKIEELGPEIDGFKLSKKVNGYLAACRETMEYGMSLLKDTEKHHLAFVPTMNALSMTEAGADPRLWLMVYQEMADIAHYEEPSGVPFGIPVEVFFCMELSLRSDDGNYSVKYEGVRDMLTEEGNIEEVAYGLAIAGIEEDWWEHDDLVTLPDRDKQVIQAMKMNEQMNEMMSGIQEMLGVEDGPDEGWFA